MSATGTDTTQRERELGAIIHAYNGVTERLKHSHEQLREEVRRLREELSRKNQQLRRRERLAALGEMAAGVAHEIRNPLGGIQLFASLLKREVADRSDALRLLDRITGGVASLESIVTDILEFGRPSEPHPDHVRFDVLVRETVELASAKAAAAGVTVHVAETLREIELITDGPMLQRALLNLLLNAIEAAGTAGRSPARVHIGGRISTNDRAIITIADNGPGIPPELMERIFNPFFTTRSNGTGLGLAIVHQIVESLGGTIQAANRSGGGSLFTVNLPKRQEGRIANCGLRIANGRSEPRTQVRGPSLA